MGYVFVHDRQTGATELISRNDAGTAGDVYSRVPAITSDGAYIAFASMATNLVANDSNGVWDIFGHERFADETVRLSVASAAGAESSGWSDGGDLSGDGSYVVFSSPGSELVADDSNGASDVFVRDVARSTTRRVSVVNGGGQANGASNEGRISDDGRYIAFTSVATNLVHSDTNGVGDVFVHDTQTLDTFRVSIASGAVRPTAARAVLRFRGMAGMSPSRRRRASGG